MTKRFIAKFSGEYLNEQEYSIVATDLDTAEKLAAEAVYDLALEQGAFEAFEDLEEEYSEDEFNHLKDESVWVQSVDEWDPSEHHAFEEYEVLVSA